MWTLNAGHQNRKLRFRKWEWFDHGHCENLKSRMSLIL